MNETDIIEELLELVDHYREIKEKYGVVGINHDYIHIGCENFILIAKGKRIRIKESGGYYHYSFIENSIEIMTVATLIKAQKINKALEIEMELKRN